MDLIDSSLANGQFPFLTVPPWSNVVGVRPALIVTRLSPIRSVKIVIPLSQIHLLL